MYYTNETKVKTFDCDVRNRMKVSAVMRYMQQVAGDHLISLGYPGDVMKAKDFAFLLSKMCIKIHRIPNFGEELILGTAPTSTKGVRFIRELVIDSKEGDRLVSAISYWPLVQPSTRKVLRPKEFGDGLPFQEDLLSDQIEDTPFPKEELTSEPKYIENVGYSEIDVNHHVNNTVYADFICDALPYELMTEADIDSFVIGFQNEAVINDKIAVRQQKITDKEFYVTGNHERAECFKGLVTFK